MRIDRFRFAFILTFAACTGSVHAGVIVNPISYDMPNGGGSAHGGGWQYWDDTYDGSGNTTIDGAPLSGGLGQLTDGVVGTDNWQVDLGNGVAYEWVGWWNTLNPTITFDFGHLVDFESFELHINNSGNGCTAMFANANLSFSTDGISFGDDMVYTTPPEELGNPSARFVMIDMPRTSRYVRATLDHTAYWLFLSEVRFTAIPEPSTTLLLMTASLFALRRRR